MHINCQRAHQIFNMSLRTRMWYVVSAALSPHWIPTNSLPPTLPTLKAYLIIYYLVCRINWQLFILFI